MYSEELKKLARECGFDNVCALNVSALEFLPQVRDMCAADRCHSYNKCWTCPPACGDLEEIERRCRDYGQGILLQTIGKLEDEFDAWGMAETEKRHQHSFYKYVLRLYHWEWERAGYVRSVPGRIHRAGIPIWHFRQWKPVDFWSVGSVRCPV